LPLKSTHKPSKLGKKSLSTPSEPHHKPNLADSQVNFSQNLGLVDEYTLF